MAVNCALVGVQLSEEPAAAKLLFTKELTTEGLLNHVAHPQYLTAVDSTMMSLTMKPQHRKNSLYDSINQPYSMLGAIDITEARGIITDNWKDIWSNFVHPDLFPGFTPKLFPGLHHARLLFSTGAAAQRKSHGRCVGRQVGGWVGRWVGIRWQRRDCC
jgi:hypothetical protein